MIITDFFFGVFEPSLCGSIIFHENRKIMCVLVAVLWFPFHFMRKCYVNAFTNIEKTSPLIFVWSYFCFQCSIVHSFWVCVFDWSCAFFSTNCSVNISWARLKIDHLFGLKNKYTEHSMNIIKFSDWSIEHALVYFMQLNLIFTKEKYPTSM